MWIGQSTGDVPLETWTGQTADRWKIGRHGHDDGAVLFLFMQDHKVRIEVGYGLESALPDADAHRIIADDIVPRMKAGDTDGAVSSGVAAMLTTIAPSYKGVTPPPEPASTPVGTGVAIFLFVVVGLFFAFLVFMVVMQVIGSIALRIPHLARRVDAREVRHAPLVVLGQRRFSRWKLVRRGRWRFRRRRRIFRRRRQLWRRRSFGRLVKG